jgi:nitrogen regulatory protein P-II 1
VELIFFLFGRYQVLEANTYRFTTRIVLKDVNVNKTILAIEKAAYTGEVGDGMIFTYSIDESVRISNGARGELSTAGPSDQLSK